MSSSPIAYVEIKPIQKIQIATRVSVQVIQYNLFKSATCQVNLYDQSGISVYNQAVTIEGEDWNQWISDDDLINIVIRKLNLQYLHESETDPKKESESMSTDVE